MPGRPVVRCYLCGKSEDLTRDHIPPKGFFPQPRPSNLITVPCCRTCNEDYAMDDEAVRLWFCSHWGASKAGEWVLENKARRGSPLLIQNMLSTLENTKINTVEEGLIEVSRYEIPIERVNRFMVRITKGLLAHYYPDYNYSGAEFQVRHIQGTVQNLDNLEFLLELLHYDEKGKVVFQSRGGLTDSKMSGAWLLVFYGAVLFFVAHSNNNFDGKLTPSHE